MFASGVARTWSVDECLRWVGSTQAMRKLLRFLTFYNLQYSELVRSKSRKILPSWLKLLMWKFSCFWLQILGSIIKIILFRSLFFREWTKLKDLEQRNLFNINSTYIPKHKQTSPKTYVTQQHVDKEDSQNSSSYALPICITLRDDNNFYYKH